MPSKMPPVKSESLNSGNGKLYCFFKRDGKFYQVACKSSLDKTLCKYIHKEFGTAVLDRATETFLHSTKPLEEDYLLFLKRNIKGWKEFYPYI